MNYSSCDYFIIVVVVVVCDDFFFSPLPPRGGVSIRDDYLLLGRSRPDTSRPLLRCIQPLPSLSVALPKDGETEEGKTGNNSR